MDPQQKECSLVKCRTKLSRTRIEGSSNYLNDVIHNSLKYRLIQNQNKSNYCCQIYSSNKKFQKYRLSSPLPHFSNCTTTRIGNSRRINSSVILTTTATRCYSCISNFCLLILFSATIISPSFALSSAPSSSASANIIIPSSLTNVSIDHNHLQQLKPDGASASFSASSSSLLSVDNSSVQHRRAILDSDSAVNIPNSSSSSSSSNNNNKRVSKDIVDEIASNDDNSIQPANNEQPFATFVYAALINDKVQLPCDINAPTSDDQMILVLWYKDDQLAPILTLDGRKNQLDSGPVISASTLKGRAYFNLQARPAHLLIDPVASSDEGDYRCRVDFRKARTINTVISLKVIVPPQVPKITDQDGNALSGLVGPYNEGDELTLTCLTKSGKPRPSLIWWRDYAIIDDSFEFDDRDVTSNELVISRLARHHLLAILMCQAINSNITTPVSNSITLDINLKPTEVRITQLTPILVADTDALFECNTYGSRPMPIIYWLFEGQRFDTRIHGEQQTTSTITIRLKRIHRGMTIECVVENIRIPDSSIRDQITLDVQYPPKLELKLGAPSLSLDSVQEGIDIYFDCHIDSNPGPTSPITWLFNGETLFPEPGVIESNQSLVLQRVQRWRNGTYQCRCANQQGTAISNQIQLEIKFAPVCRTPYTLIYGLNLNELVQIGCEVEARPSQVSFQWRFEKQNNLPNFVQINNSKSILEYLPRTREQYGLIECTAKNEIGIQREPCRFLVVPAAGPFFPYNCLVSNQSDSTVSIRCDGPMNNSSSGNSLPDLYKMNPSLSIVSSTPSTSIDDDDNEDDDENDDQMANNAIRMKNHYRRPMYDNDLANSQTNSLTNNLTTSDIYALYFAPDDGSGEEEENGGLNSKKLTYRNGGVLPHLPATRAFGGFESQLENSAALLLNELVSRFNSHPLSQQPHLFVYPPTYYICEIYALTPRPTLIKNVTIDAVGRRIMNPFNGSFSFLVDKLPANSPLRVNIYARNTRKRSPVQVELDARTLPAAERRIDSSGSSSGILGGGISIGGGIGGGGDPTQEGHARGRKSSFFEELYGGYGRFRSKHLVVGLLIGTVAVAIFVAILLIIIATIRTKHSENSAMAGDNCDNGGGGNGRMMMMGEKVSIGNLKHNKKQDKCKSKSNLNLNSDNMLDDLAIETKETTFVCNGDGMTDTMEIDKMVNNSQYGGSSVGAGDYGQYGMDGDDDSSMRSDHQLITSHNQTISYQTAATPSNIYQTQPQQPKYYQTLLPSHKQRPGQQTTGPPSYFDLEPSIVSTTVDATGNGTFVNLLTGSSSVGVDQPPPDLIQHTAYGNEDHGNGHHHNQHPHLNQRHHDTNNNNNNLSKDGLRSSQSGTGAATIFDTISFGHQTAHEHQQSHEINSMEHSLSSGTTMIVSTDQISGNVIHFSSPIRKYSTGDSTVGRSILLTATSSAATVGTVRSHPHPHHQQQQSSQAPLLAPPSQYPHHPGHHHYGSGTSASHQQHYYQNSDLMNGGGSSSSSQSGAGVQSSPGAATTLFATLPRASSTTAAASHHHQSGTTIGTLNGTNLLVQQDPNSPGSYIYIQQSAPTSYNQPSQQQQHQQSNTGTLKRRSSLVGTNLEQIPGNNVQQQQQQQ